MKLRRLLTLAGTAAAFCTTPALARQDIIPGSRYTSARIAGMADAGLPMADDVMSGLFYNPAALSKVQHVRIEPLLVQLYLNQGYITGLGLDFYNIFFNQPAYAKSTFQGWGGAVAPSFGFKYFFFGVLFQNQFGSRNTGGGIAYRSLYQLIPTVGTAFSIADGVLRLGYSLQWVNSAVGNFLATPGASTAHYNTGLSQGSAFSHTMGVTVTLPMSFLPQLNFVVRNFLNATYMPFTLLPVASGSPGLPPTEPMSFDGAFGIRPKFGRGLALAISLQYRDIANTANTIFISHLALGAEFSIRDMLFFRGGFQGGYASAGFGVRTKSSEFNIAWYSEELGSTYLGQQDMRYLLQYQIHFP